MSSFAFESPIGLLLIEVTPNGLRRVDFLSHWTRRMQLAETDPVLLRLSEGVRLTSEVEGPEREVADAVENQLREYFEGSRHDFDLPLDIDTGSVFQRRVWQAIAQIPYGATASYAKVAAEAGSPGAFRAAGSACGNNPVALVVPCHRVLASGNRLGGYGGGLETKVWLLRHEGLTCSAAKSDALVRPAETAELGI